MRAGLALILFEVALKSSRVKDKVRFGSRSVYNDDIDTLEPQLATGSRRGWTGACALSSWRFEQRCGYSELYEVPELFASLLNYKSVDYMLGSITRSA